MAEQTVIRTARPEDHARITAVADDWWGRPVSGILPRLFLDHFHPTSLVADAGEELAGFVIGFFSPGDGRTAYIHFTGVAPDQRRTGLARELYRRFFDLAKADGRTRVHAVTAPFNTGSIAFHTAMGFTASDPIPDYDGPGLDRVRFERPL
ncbi:GNAT family N-acetyltransferase [Nocardiopsis potens]|uniref:GNAT family N-acetyltransferase n=1 Tax=Nocardiopsis potens TaxID=1246458 RepID=UPI00034A1E58|nr:GNAT family N-acetyltransferase [Nocardiopsis potens]